MSWESSIEYERMVNEGSAPDDVDVASVPTTGLHADAACGGAALTDRAMPVSPERPAARDWPVTAIRIGAHDCRT
jgi:hypothetical protein